MKRLLQPFVYATALSNWLPNDLDNDEMTDDF